MILSPWANPENGRYNEKQKGDLTIALIFILERFSKIGNRNKMQERNSTGKPGDHEVL
jgi:hypothetical protein